MASSSLTLRRENFDIAAPEGGVHKKFSKTDAVSTASVLNLINKSDEASKNHHYLLLFNSRQYNVQFNKPWAY